MAIERFLWPTQRGGATTVEYRTRQARFGGGYRQVVGDGPNNREDSHAITVTADRQTMQAILAFFDRHAGAKAFLWTTPLGELGLYTCADPATTPVGGGRFTVAGTFQRAYHP
ncbi:phage tail protein [Pseudomonas monteilii]